MRCPTCAHAPLSHRRCGSDTRHEQRDHWRLRRERCSKLLRASRWRSRLRRTKPAATLQRVDGMMPDLERGLGRAVPRSRITKRKHRSGAPADGASLRAAFAPIFGKANAPGSCECNGSHALARGPSRHPRPDRGPSPSRPPRTCSAHDLASSYHNACSTIRLRGCPRCSRSHVP